MSTGRTESLSSLLHRWSAAAMPSKLEGAMDALITVFHNYSGNEGDKYKLNKGELKELLNSELTDFLMVSKQNFTSILISVSCFRVMTDIKMTFEIQSTL